MRLKFGNLALEGGGVWGIAYAGALEELGEAGVLGGIKRVAGTCAGSIVALLLALGFGSNDISKVISPRTVKPHTLNIYQKLDVNGRLQAVDKASELGILA